MLPTCAECGFPPGRHQIQDMGHEFKSRCPSNPLFMVGCRCGGWYNGIYHPTQYQLEELLINLLQAKRT